MSPASPATATDHHSAVLAQPEDKKVKERQQALKNTRYRGPDGLWHGPSQRKVDRERRAGQLIKRGEYLRLANGSIIRKNPKPLHKKQRNKQSRAIVTRPGGFVFLCACKKATYHFPAKVKVRLEGYENKQEMETYQCCICDVHAIREKVDEEMEARKVNRIGEESA